MHRWHELGEAKSALTWAQSAMRSARETLVDVREPDKPSGADVVSAEIAESIAVAASKVSGLLSSVAEPRPSASADVMIESQGSPPKCDMSRDLVQRVANTLGLSIASLAEDSKDAPPDAAVCDWLSARVFPDASDGKISVRRVLGGGAQGVVLSCEWQPRRRRRPVVFVAKAGTIGMEEESVQTLLAKDGIAPRVIDLVDVGVCPMDYELSHPRFGRLLMEPIDGTVREWFVDPVRVAADYPVALNNLYGLIQRLYHLSVLHGDFMLQNVAYVRANPESKQARVLLIDFGNARKGRSCPFLEYVTLFISVIEVQLKDIPNLVTTWESAHTSAEAVDDPLYDAERGEMLARTSLYAKMADAWIRSVWRMMRTLFPLTHRAAFPSPPKNTSLVLLDVDARRAQKVAFATASNLNVPPESLESDARLKALVFGA